MSESLTVGGWRLQGDAALEAFELAADFPSTQACSTTRCLAAVTDAVLSSAGCCCSQTSGV